ncbi:MAG: site-specific DNA-methyltransferase [Lachnospiraceae bacterium]|nr:site-specific DNA-methyltransferase [Lachnospiraceae bacterium]
MDKMKMESVDMTTKNIEQIGAMFPNCITETMGTDGKTRKAINFDLLRQMLSDDVIDGDESYEFTWTGKKASIAEANKPTHKTLRPCFEESIEWDTTENLYIEGDNLEILKLLQESYLEKVKMIYIDPPYNTGNDFIYRDNFAQSTGEYADKSGQYNEDTGDRLFKNSDSNGRFHSDWCSMMYSRLMLARNLLRKDGVIFISIDDNECQNLRKICDEVFGEINFRSDISWQKRYTRSNNTVDFTNVIEHILVYAKTDDFNVNLLPRTEAADNRYTNPDNDPRGVWKGASFLNPATPAQRPNLCYPITNPNTGTTTYPTTNAWRRSKEVYEELLTENKLYWGIDGKSSVPSIKMFLSDARGLTPTNFWDHEYAGNTDEGTADLLELMGSKIFENPKPVKLIIRALEHATNATTEDIILDFFSGSATTAQAIMKLNAEDNGKRKFIMIQLPEACHDKSEAYKVGYRDICEIGKERIRRAGKKIKEENPQATNLDIGFRVFKLDDSNMKDVYYSAGDYSQSMLAGLESNIKEDRTDLDLFFGCLLDWGLPLSLPYTSEVIDGCTVHTYNDGDLVACFDENMPDSVIKSIAKKQPLRAVFRDSSFEGSPAKINVGEIFKLLAPNTTIKVL